MRLDGYFGLDRLESEGNSEQKKLALLRRYDDLLFSCKMKQQELATLILRNLSSSSTEDTDRLARAQETIKRSENIDRDNIDLNELRDIVQKLEINDRNIEGHIRTYEEKS